MPDRKLKSADIMKTIRKNIQKNESFGKNLIEYKIAVLREYADPGLLLPHNPFLRLIKKALLSFHKPYLKSQVVFNNNAIEILKELHKRNNDLENQIKVLKKRRK